MNGRRSRDRLGSAFTSLAAGALALNLVMIGGLLLVLALNGLGSFWPASLVELQLDDGDTVLGPIREREEGPLGGARVRVETGNRELSGVSFRWVEEARVRERSLPRDAVLLERIEWGNFIGYLAALRDGEGRELRGPALWQELPELLETKRTQREELRALEHRLGRERGSARELAQGQARLEQLRDSFASGTLIAETATGQRHEIPVGEVVRALRPNAMSRMARTGLYLARGWEFVAGEPRESNTEGGIFPAIFGTMMMVFLMSLAVVPFGVLAALYMHEYAKDGPLLRTMRIAVNNLAGVPSIVFGVFGLGFFVYLVGGSIDQLFYSETLPAPTFGTGGILWASLTLALLTVPVVIVATEEGLSAVPRALREGSLALGATQFETIRRVVLPAALPGVLTGVILAVGRAAGEVAPLMIVGMVKLAPSLPIDSLAPYVHLERKFMHLGFHIYDLAFQSPNVEATLPLVYATALLLVAMVLVTNLAAIALRARLRQRNASSSV